jgi:hypothetical protein
MRRHGKQGHLVWRGQSRARHAGADGFADAEFFPKPAGRQHDAKFEDEIDVDVDLGDGGLAADRQGVGGIGVDDVVDADDQALQGGVAETVRHPHFGALGLGVLFVLGEGVVGDRRAVAVKAASSWACRASSAFCAASCSVVPPLAQPGTSGENTLEPSTSFWTTAE